MWANKEGEREVGKGLAHFLCWMTIQASVIVILEGLHLLPGDVLGRPIDYSELPIEFTLYCGVIGGIYTAVGCLIILKHEVNTKGWWLNSLGWYLLYLPLSYLAFYDYIGWRVVDVWIAPILWIGEIELIYFLQIKNGDRIWKWITRRFPETE